MENFDSACIYYYLSCKRCFVCPIQSGAILLRKYNTDKYEEFAFWAKGGKRAGIYYTYGKDHRNIPVQYLGIDKINGEKCFKVKFSNGYSLFIIPRGNQLNFIDSAGKYNKTFSWEYEGPVNGIGTHCDICAEDDKDAMNLMRSCYLR